ncbi:hypothetical protein [Vibrio taketomensis]|uniref:hypothetical protein n=1 Tax=Vibrio taketomensis TaxID=2572923 RepID=UPI0013896D2D|nr:hypothetical protein [Vibrio taketomensis]
MQTSKKSTSKMSKNHFEERFAQMVGEYNAAKEELATLEEGTAEYIKQNKLCEKLFASAERFINSHQ